MEQKETASLVAVKQIGYGGVGTSRMPMTLTRRQKINESVDIALSIQNKWRDEEPVFPLFHAIQDLTADDPLDIWRLVVDEKAFYGAFLHTTRVGERSLIPQADLAFILEDAHPEFLRMIYAQLDVLRLNRYAYHIERKEELMDLPPTGNTTDDKVDEKVGPPQKRFISYVLIFNGHETRHLRVRQGKSKRHVILLLPSPRTHLPVVVQSTEEDTDSESAGQQDTMFMT